MTGTPLEKTVIKSDSPLLQKEKEKVEGPD